MNQEAKKWIANKVRSEIVGMCCNISNACGHKHPIVLKDLSNSRYLSLDKSHNEEIEKSLNKMKFLLSNFGEFIDIDNIIEDHFLIKSNQNQWSTEGHRVTFKLYIKDALQLVRDEKLIEIGV